MPYIVTSGVLTLKGRIVRVNEPVTDADLEGVDIDRLVGLNVIAPTVDQEAQAEPEQQPAAKPKPLARMNSAELKAECGKLGIPLDGLNSNADMVKAIEAKLNGTQAEPEQQPAASAKVGIKLESGAIFSLDADDKLTANGGPIAEASVKDLAKAAQQLGLVVADPNDRDGLAEAITEKLAALQNADDARRKELAELSNDAFSALITNLGINPDDYADQAALFDAIIEAEEAEDAQKAESAGEPAQE